VVDSRAGEAFNRNILTHRYGALCADYRISQSVKITAAGGLIMLAALVAQRIETFSYLIKLPSKRPRH
jgi:hypothetical protein